MALPGSSIIVDAFEVGNACRNGDTTSAGIGAGFIVLDLLTFGLVSTGKEVTKIVGKAGAFQAAKETTKTAAKEGGEAAGKAVGKEVGKKLSKDIAKGTIKEISKQAFEEETRTTGKDALRAAVTRTLKGRGKGIFITVVKEAGESVLRNALCFEERMEVRAGDQWRLHRFRLLKS